MERQFLTAQDRLVKGMRVAGVCAIEAANAYLEEEFLPWWNRTLTVKSAHAEDAHRSLTKEYDLAAILSHVEQRQLDNGYVLRYDGKFYRVDPKDVRAGMRKAWVRVEDRLDGKIAVRHEGRYVGVSRCPQPEKHATKTAAPSRSEPKGTPKHKSGWMKDFSIRSGRSLRLAIRVSNARD